LLSNKALLWRRTGRVRSFYWWLGYSPPSSRISFSRCAHHLPPTLRADLMKPRSSRWWVCRRVRSITLLIPSTPQTSGQDSCWAGSGLCVRLIFAARVLGPVVVTSRQRRRVFSDTQIWSGRELKPSGRSFTRRG